MLQFSSGDVSAKNTGSGSHDLQQQVCTFIKAPVKCDNAKETISGSLLVRMMITKLCGVKIYI